MSAAAQIKFTQNSVSNTPGQAMTGVTGEAVTVGNWLDNSTITNWKFDILDVSMPSSSLTLGTQQNGATPTWSFTPDATRGMVFVQLTTTANDGTIAISRLCFGVPDVSTGRMHPAFGATARHVNFGGSTRGWAALTDAYEEAVDEGGGEVIYQFWSSLPVVDGANQVALEDSFIGWTLVDYTATSAYDVQLYSADGGTNVMVMQNASSYDATILSSFVPGTIELRVNQTKLIYKPNDIGGAVGSGIRAVADAPVPQVFKNPSQDLQIKILGSDQVVAVDATRFDDLVPLVMPLATSIDSGQKLTVLDPANSWAAKQVSLGVEAGVNLEDPSNPGTYVSGGTLNLPQANSASYTWVLLWLPDPEGPSTTWKLVAAFGGALG